MKALSLFRKTLSLVLTLALFVFVAISCKKDTDETPVIPEPPVMPVMPDVLASQPLKMMSKFETDHQFAFPGHLMYQLGHGMVGEEDPGILGPFKEIASSLWDIYNYETTGQSFTTIDNGLSQIETQAADMLSQIASIGQEINMQTTQLENFITTGDMNTYIGDIKAVMSVGSPQGLRYFAYEGAQYQANPAGMLTQIKKDSGYAVTFVNNVMVGASSYAVLDWVSEINELICPTMGSPSTNALNTYAKLLVQEAAPKHFSNPDTLMLVYKLLECYFLTAVNYQFQCYTVYASACNATDTSGYLTKTWCNLTFAPIITQEVVAFLEATDYLAVNLAEYRDSTRFKNDMQYANAGLAPDNQFVHILARAQFISNLLCDAVGLSYPVMSGHVVIPANYSSSATPGLNVTIGAVSKDTIPKQYQSQIPYTYWTSANPPVCDPDTTWNVYRFGTIGKSDGSWPNTSYKIALVTSPWVHFENVSGTMTPLWYNPSNPSQTSTTQSSVYSMQFAYFSATWQWGFLQLTNSQLSPNWYKTNYDPNIILNGFFDFSSFNGNLIPNQVSLPFAGTSNGSGSNSKVTKQSTPLTWSNKYGTPGMMSVGNGNTATTSHYYVIIDGNYLNVKTGIKVPALGNGEIQAWAWYNVNYGMAGSGGNDLTVNIGTNRTYSWWPYESDYQYSVGGDVVRTNWHDKAGSTTWNSGFGMNKKLVTNGSYQPGVQYYYQTANVGSAVPASITLISGFQFVYTGYYNVPSPPAK